MGFETLGLSEAILKAVVDAGYTIPTPIQEQAIPIVLQGRDVLGCAQTGTGKTASFTLPMVEMLSQGRAKARMPRSLILEPTRELAAQVAESFDKYGKHTKLTKALIIGGTSMGDQETVLDRGVDVLIATPGRMLDLFERGRILLADVKILVIDEADRMLDMGFIPDVERIAGLLPQMRQTLFFSATMPPEIRRLADKFLSNPKEISVSPPATTAATVTQHLCLVDSRAKADALKELIASEDVKNAIIFCNRKRDIGTLHRTLQRAGLNAGCLHGDLPQSKRTETLDAFRRGEITLLVASDVAARGLDISDLSHVFNYDVPIHAEDYVHRIGRTGRAGREGRAFTLATSEDRKYVTAIERLVGKAIPPYAIPGAAVAAAPAPVEGIADAAAEPPAPPAPRRERSRGERPRREDRPRREPRSDAPAQEAAQHEAPRESAGDGGRGGRRDERGGERRPQRDRDDGPAVRGLGDHVPAFLLRPAPPVPQSADSIVPEAEAA
ncbi:MAG: DEAD/DEAH box helicase [Alphaproteobacteria bacterium]|nr:DEAD/DEAH box helicase [Alphaproteobacteria bacterium]